MMNRRDLLAVLGAVAFCASSAPCIAQAPAWPTAKPITYVVPIFPGSTADVVARIVAQKLSESLRQSIVVDNKPGAGGSIGTAAVAKAAPDGYTLLAGTSGTHAINVGLYKNLPYDPIRDFEPVALVGSVPQVLVVAPSLGVNSVQELIALLKKDPKVRTFGSAGSGTAPHLAGEMFGEIIGVPLTHVAYKSNPGLTDVASGLLGFKFDQLTSVLPLMQAGKIKVLAVTSPERIPLLPNVPTMIEAGVPGFEVTSWHAVYVPKGTPKPIVERLGAEVTKAVNAPDAKAKLNDLGLVVSGAPGTEVSALMASEIPRWAEVIKKSGATAD